MKKLPIGISSFKEIIDNNYYFVDKSLFIKEIIDFGSKAILITRPRRFGKTLNLSMLQYFFEKTTTSQKNLFDGLEISKHPEIFEKQGQSPVIFLTFKDVKSESWNECYNLITQLISQEFERHGYLLESGILSNIQKNDFIEITQRTAAPTVFQNALKSLSEYLAKFHKQNPIILIDEYDTPIQAGFLNGYYDQVIGFIRGLLSAGLKDNTFLNFSVITGILRIAPLRSSPLARSFEGQAKESIFSGLNNLNVCTLLSSEYSDKFGLTESEVGKILEYYKIAESIDEVKKWYDGYSTLKATNLYNPWSIINFVGKDRIFRPYWINTSSNDIVKDLVQVGGASLKIEFEKLLSGQTTTQEINENIVFQSLKTNTNTVWNFLLATGYLTFNKTWLDETRLQAELAIPNLEVKHFYETTILNWFLHDIEDADYKSMLASLVSGNIEEFKELFSNFAFKSLSYFDVNGNEPERFYHAFVLGMLVSLNQNYKIKSNRESGLGRYDVILIPSDKTQPGVIIEFKKVSVYLKETLQAAADKAMKQIEDRNYASELHEIGIKKIVKLAIAFEGKKVLIKDAIE